ncbi:hypothetical protein [uncultured Flavobacterium sp.]|uniref:hypothetical protein n=1 Tax=uncultured Flavobacterium sp. TaxID=165435 RepID=UPI0025CCE7A0|nr:hypothetical protein [uncultured Flavobacterium sp.]
MIRFTKLVKSVSLLALVLLMAHCTTNEAEKNSNVQLATETKNWYDNHKQDYDAVILNYVKNLQWENAIVSTGKDGEVVEVPFTLDDNLKTSNGTATLRNDSHRLVFVKDGQQNFKTYYIQIFADDENSSNIDKSSVYYGALNNFSGKIFTQDLLTNSATSITYKNGINSKLSSTAKWREEFYDCTFLGWIGEDGSFEPIKLLYCDGGSDAPTGGGPTTGGGGGGSGVTIPTEDSAPPSCHSFDFKALPGANWQEALVKNIRFKIVLLSETGAEIIHAVSYPQPISFGAPVVNRYNTTYSAGVSADIAAKALKESIQNVVDKYGRQRVSDLVLDQYFRERLNHNYNYYMDGGRVQFNSPSATPATEYKTTFLWSDDCVLD